MNKQMKKHLEAVVESIVSKDVVAAKEAFQQYLSLKTKSLLSESSDCDDMDDKDDKKKDDKDDKKKDDKKVDSDLEKVDDDVKKAKSDQKKDEGDEK